MSLIDVPRLFLTEVQDTYSRDNFRKILAFFRMVAPLSNFKGFEVTFTGAETHHKFTHKLGFLPKDILLTSKTGTGSVQFNYELSDVTNIDITVTGPCVVRFLAGAFN